MRKPLLVLEDIAERRRVFRISAVSWWATRYAWVGPIFWVGLGLAMALADRRHTGAAEVATAALWYGVVLYASNTLHSLGHVIAGRLVRAPVEAILMTSTRDVVIYARPGPAAAARQRVGRSLGGPLTNLAVGCGLIVCGGLTHSAWAFMSGIMNLCVAVWTIMPVPTLDGWVIWSSVVGHSRKEGS